MTDELTVFYASALEFDGNIHTVFTDPDTGDTVVYVVDDAPEALAPYATRTLGVRFVKAPIFKAPPPDDLKPLDIPTKRFRPAPAGVSCGSHRITAGTLGLIVQDVLTGKKAVLSNNHVLADVDAGKVGDDIVQPGIADGGIRNGDTIARLTRWQPLRTSTTRLIDAAVADVLRDEDVSLNVNELGYVYGISDPYPHEQIAKSGRTTTLSRGEVAAIGAKVRVDYGAAGVISLDDCTILNLYSAPGDSGSPILDFCSHNLLGLLFAGNGLQTIACKASHIARLLSIEIIQPPEIMASMWVDVSHWQGDIDWAKMKANGVRGAVMKVCQSDFTDRRFVEYYDGARAAGLLVGGYIYVDPAASANVHYNTFVQSVGERKFDLPVALDCEQASGQSKATITAIIQQLSNLVTQRQEGQRPFIYTNISFWNSNVSPWSEWANHPLWMAYWTTREVYRPAVPYSWQGTDGHNLPGKPELWQVGPMDIGPYMGVESTQLDINKSFRGLEYLLGEPAPDPDPDPDPDPNPDPDPEPDPDEPAEYIHHKARVIAANGLNIRSGPGTQFARVGAMPAGAVPDVLSETISGGDIWMQTGWMQFAARVYRGQELAVIVKKGEPLAHGIMRVYGRLANVWNRLLSWLSIGEA